MSVPFLSLIMQPSDGYKGTGTKNKGGGGSGRGCFPRQRWLWQPWSRPTHISLQARSRVHRVNVGHCTFQPSALLPKPRLPQHSPANDWALQGHLILVLATPASFRSLLMGNRCTRTPHWRGWGLRTALNSDAFPTQAFFLPSLNSRGSCLEPGLLAALSVLPLNPSPSITHRDLPSQPRDLFHVWPWKTSRIQLKSDLNQHSSESVTNESSSDLWKISPAGDWQFLSRQLTFPRTMKHDSSFVNSWALAVSHLYLF